MKFTIFTTLILFSIIVFAGTLQEARSVAAIYLRVDNVSLESESENSYFLVTELEYEKDDFTGNFPCFRGVVVNKKTNKIIDPLSDEKIQTSFDYSDTSYNDLVVINCAD